MFIKRWLAITLVLLAPTVWADDCTSTRCDYTVSLDRVGIYEVVVTLTSEQTEGLWTLTMNPARFSVPYVGGFTAGSVLKEQGELPNWLAFSTTRVEPINIIPHDLTGDDSPLTVQIDRETGDGPRTLVYGPTLMNLEQSYTTPNLDPGFYILSFSSQPDSPRTYREIAVEGNSLYGGVVGGWLDSSGKGHLTFRKNSPEVVDFSLFFGESAGSLGSSQPHLEVYFQDDNGARELYWSAPRLTPKPPATELPIDPNSSWEDTVKFIYTGDNPVQTPITQDGTTTPIEIDPNSAVVIMGKVVDSFGNPLPGVKITVEGCEECGQTSTSDGSNFLAPGEFIIAVNGTGKWTIKYDKENYISLQLPVTVDCSQTVVRANIRALVKREEGEGLTLQAGGGSSASGGVVTDAAGSRQARLFFPEGTEATMVLPDCSEQQLNNPHVSVTEYTQGAPGIEGESTGMPFELPSGTGYTYAVEFTVDEAEEANAREVKFNQPVAVYVDNFLGFPVGTIVPSGYYDYNLERWVPSENGYVIKILGSDNNGLAKFDLANTGLTITDEEKQQVTEWYSSEEWYKNKTGKEFWRIPIMHFSPFDFNYPRATDPDAIDPDVLEADDQDKKEEDDKNDCDVPGCIIEAQNQTLGETLPVVGTPFNLNYRSSRVPGRKAAYTLDIPLRNSDKPLPESLKRIRLEIDIAGRRKIEEIFSKTNVPEVYHFVWDGKDDLGRPLPGTHQATIKIDYIYDAYYQLPADVAKSFGLEGQGDIQNGRVRVPARQEIAKSKNYTRELGGLDAKTIVGLGGWTLDIHHVYDSINRVLYEGNGGQRVVTKTPKPQSQPQPQIEIEPQPQPPQPQRVDLTNVDLTNDIRVSHCTPICDVPLQCVADCGKVLVGAAHVEMDAIQWIGSDVPDSLSATSGNKAFGFTGLSSYGSGADNEWGFHNPQSVSINKPLAFNTSPSLGFFFSPEDKGKVESNMSYNASKSYEPTEPPKYGTGTKTVTVRGEGQVDDKVNPAITLDIAINGTPQTVDASAQCMQANNETVFTITPRVNPDSPVLTEVSPVQHVIVDLEIKEKDTPQSSCNSFKNEGITSNNFVLDDYFHYLPSNSNGCKYSALLSVGKPVQLKIIHQHDTQNDINPKGYVQYHFSVRDHTSDNPAEWQGSYKKFHLTSNSNTTRRRFTSVRRGGQCSLSNKPLFNGRIASRDGGLLYEFENDRHVHTLDSLTGKKIYTFGYDEKGYLVTITDIDGDITTIERDAENKPVAIVAPYGQRTTLTLDDKGYIASVSNKANETHKLVYMSDGLLTQYIDPRGNAENYEYDALGLFVRNTEPTGGGYTVSREDNPDGSYTTTLTSREGRVSTYKVQNNERINERINTASDGTSTTVREHKDNTRVVHSADGTLIWSQKEQDKRLTNIHASPKTKVTTIEMPSGLKAEIVTETATNPLPIADDYDPLNLKTLTQKVTVNGRQSRSVFDKAANTITAISAAGRKSVSVLDDKGRVAIEQAAGFADTQYEYDEHGRLKGVSVGEGIDLRTASLEYDPRGNINKVTDALGRQVRFEYDAVGRVTKQTLTNDRQILYSYDANGNVTAITPPGRPAHGFAYNGEDLQTQYTPPPAGLATPQTQYVYNLDKQLTKIVRPDGQPVDFVYDAVKGRLNALKTPHGQYSYTYDDTSGNLTAVTAPNGSSLGYTYDGSLPLSVTWNGQVTGTLAVTYDNDFRVISTNINGSHAVNYEYDADSLLIKAGDLWLVRDPENGLLKGTQLGGKDGITTQRTYNQFGELASDTASDSGNVRYSNQYTRDKLGRITQKTEVVEGITSIYMYEYDPAGRLVKVTQDGAVTEQYTYDDNGNRLSANTATHGAVNGSYDEQDRLLQYGGNTYTYTANGELLNKTSNGATTQYNYDVLGNLRSVQLPDGIQIEYVIDANGRRMGKKVNGVLTQSLLYQGTLNPIAELDGNGNVVARFVYGSKANVPDYIIKNGNTYRIISDHLGSPRLLIDLNTGAIVQRMDYDAFGNVVLDTNPGFQPFGFAGGIYDFDTGLVRFGARDYDSETGRWTEKDPISFNNIDLNLYRYVLNDPINFLDPLGLFTTSSGSVSFHEGIGGQLSGSFKFDDKGNIGFEACIGVGIGVGTGKVEGIVDFSPGDLKEGGHIKLGVEASASAWGGKVSVYLESLTIDERGCPKLGGVLLGTPDSFLFGIVGLGAEVALDFKVCGGKVINVPKIINNFVNRYINTHNTSGRVDA